MFLKKICGKFMQTLNSVDQQKWEEIIFKDHPLHDRCWAISLGPGDNVYISVCLEGRGGGTAQLYSYNIKKRQLRHVLDMAEVTGEKADNGHASQGKIHFALCPASDGNLYGATHCTTPPMGDVFWSPYGMWDDPIKGYPGAHIFRHNTITGETLDFGILFPNEGISFLMLDEKRGRLYGMTYPKAHFFRTNLAGRELIDYGRVSSWYTLSMVFDLDGNIFTSDFNSRLIKYDVENDKLIFFNSTPPSRPWNHSKRCSWISDMCIGPDKKIYGVHYSNDCLFRFNPAEKIPKFEDLGPGLGKERASYLRCLIPDHQGNIYYIAWIEISGRRAFESIFVRYNAASGKKEVLGLMKLNGKAFMGWRGVCDGDGNIYIANTENMPVRLLIYRPGT